MWSKPFAKSDYGVNADITISEGIEELLGVIGVQHTLIDVLNTGIRCHHRKNDVERKPFVYTDIFLLIDPTLIGAHEGLKADDPVGNERGNLPLACLNTVVAPIVGNSLVHPVKGFIEKMVADIQLKVRVTRVFQEAVEEINEVINPLLQLRQRSGSIS